MKYRAHISGNGNVELLSDARATEQSAINKLHVLGASDEDIEQLNKSGVTSHLIIRAPLSGVVAKRNMDPARSSTPEITS